MTLAARTDQGARALRAAGFSADESRRDAAVLARAVLGWDAARWLTQQRDTATDSFGASLADSIARRIAREPVVYIIGEREFYGRSFRVTRQVLIPRPETELVVDIALEALSSRCSRPFTGDRPTASIPTVIDVGTGSGCLAVTLALECPAARVIATDVSSSAIRVAAENAEHLGARGRVQFRVEPLVGSWATGADVIVSNPPYVADAERESLAPDVVDYEPSVALFGGADGLDVIRALVPAAARALRPGGWFVMEIGCGQQSAAEALVTATPGLRVSETRRDLQNLPRVVVARATASAGPR